jgi:hypothetical protein
MPTLNVPREQWGEFLESFSRRHRAWLATVDQSADAIALGRSAEAPLGAIKATREGRDVRAIEIVLAGDGHVPVRIENPRTIRVEQTGGGAESGLEIVDAEGVSTHVGFRTTVRPEMVDGLAPGEM